MLCHKNYTDNLWGLRDDFHKKWRNPFGCCYRFKRSTKVADVTPNISTPVLSVTILPTDIEIAAKSPSPQRSPDKFSIPEQPHIIARQPFSSGSESSGYFTPPPGATHAEEQEISPKSARRNSTPKRFIQIESPAKISTFDSDAETIEDEVESNNDLHVDENVSENEDDKVSDGNVVDDVDGKVDEDIEENIDEEVDKNVSNDDVDKNVVIEENISIESPRLQKFERKSTTNSLESFNFDSFDNRTLSKNDTTNSLDFTSIKFTEKLSNSEIDINISAQISRKAVNSAPALNDLIRSYEDIPTKTSLPGSCVDSLEDTEIPDELFQTSPLKKSPKKIITPKCVRRKPTKSSTKKVDSAVSRPYAKPREALHDITTQLDSNEWEVNMKGLQALVRLIRHHKDVVENQMHAICVLLGKHIRNLRSQVARSACLAATELFGISKRPLEMELDELAAPLLHRTADTNKFLRSDANAALDEMSVNLSIPKVVSVISYRGCGHQNAIVRCASARLLCNLVNRLGHEKIFQLPKDTRDKILIAGANLLTEGSLETRKHAKMLLARLSEHVQFQRALTESVPAHVLRHIEKTLKSIMK